jgi:hypothetical protein
LGEHDCFFKFSIFQFSIFYFPDLRLRFMNKLVGGNEEESRWYWIQRLLPLPVIDTII